MSLIIHKSKPWERHVPLQYHTLQSWTESAAIDTEDYNMTSFEEARRDVRRDLDVLEVIFLRTQKGRSESTPPDGDPYETSYETFDGYTQIINYAAGITYRTDFENEDITETSATFNVNGVTIDGARFKSTFETIETDFTESKTIEWFLALDVQSRFSFSDEKTNYFLADLPDTRYLTREARGLTASIRKEEYARFGSTNSDVTSTNGVFRLSVHQYWRTADIFDSGDIFHKLQRSEFSTDLLTFSAMWHEIADGAEVEVTAKKLHIDGVPVKALAENIETVTFSVSAYQLSVHELNDQGKWNLVAASFEEVRLTGTGLGWTVLEDVTVTAFTYQIPALERHGEHASVLKMINVIGNDIIKVTFLSPRHHDIFYESKSTWADEDGATASAETYKGTYTVEYIIEGIEAVEVDPFDALLVQSVRTPGYVPFGSMVEEKLFHSFESRELTATFDSESASFLFELPAPKLNGRVFAGQRKLDLCPVSYPVTVTKEFTYSVESLNAAYPFIASETTAELTRRATATQRWEYPEGDATTFETATLHQTVRDSDGFVSARAIEYSLKTPIKKTEQTGHTINNFSRGWEIVGPDAPATLYFGRCLLHYTTVSNGVESYRTRVAVSADSFSISAGLAVAIKIEPLWQAMGTMGPMGPMAAGNVMTRGSQYLL